MKKMSIILGLLVIGFGVTKYKHIQYKKQHHSLSVSYGDNIFKYELSDLLHQNPMTQEIIAYNKTEKMKCDSISKITYIDYLFN
jgi:hypothetical protein